MILKKNYDKNKKNKENFGFTGIRIPNHLKQKLCSVKVPRRINE